MYSWSPEPSNPRFYGIILIPKFKIILVWRLTISFAEWLHFSVLFFVLFYSHDTYFEVNSAK